MTISTQQFFSLEPKIIDENGKRYDIHSNFSAAVKHARGETGRREDDGTIIDTNRTQSWLGNLAYLCLVDLLAECFDTRGSNTNRSKIIGFLEDNGFSMAEAEAVYALRCSFAHEFGLANKAINQNQVSYIFRLVADSTTPLVSSAVVPWNGNYGSVTNDNETLVNLQGIADRVESITAVLKQKADAGTLTRRLPDDEFSIRFFIKIGPI